MIQGIQSPKNSFKPGVPTVPPFKPGIPDVQNNTIPPFKPGVPTEKPHVPKEKGPDIGALLAGKNKVLNGAERLAQLGKANETKLNLTA